MTAQLALNGGSRGIQTESMPAVKWPIMTTEHEEAVLTVLRAGKMSGMDVTRQFEKEFAAWQQTRLALACNTGTAALHSAMWACGVGVGDEIIGPSLTYWASVLPALSLGASVVFAEVEPHTLCIDPADIARRITSRTKAVVAVHYCGYPCDMDPIMAIAEKHGIKVIEDVSHAQGGRYKGRMVGTIGHIGAMSLMTGKSFPIGEGGMIVTDDPDLYERCVFFGHYARTTQTRWDDGGDLVRSEKLARYAGLPMGGVKYRMHQLSSAVGRVQLRHYDGQMARIQEAMNYFWDRLEGLPGLKPHRPASDSGSTMGGWYYAHGLYHAEELGGLPVARFCEALTAEGILYLRGGANDPLHLHPLFHEADIYGHGKPTNIAHTDRDLRQGPGSLPVTESMPNRCCTIPWFKYLDKKIIDEHVAAYRKVIEHADDIAF